MSIFKELESLYSEIDGNYAKLEFEARVRHAHNIEEEWSRKRELNDHAYYLFMFTRLEDHIREQSSKLITDKQDNLTDWEDTLFRDHFGLAVRYAMPISTHPTRLSPVTKTA